MRFNHAEHFRQAFLMMLNELLCPLLQANLRKIPMARQRMGYETQQDFSGKKFIKLGQVPANV